MKSEKVYGIWMTSPTSEDGWVWVTSQEMMFHSPYIQIVNIQVNVWKKLAVEQKWDREFEVMEVGVDGEPVEVEDVSGR